ncbi:hypothetical protein HQN87_29465 [Paenibacillus tritici]|jgi:hypothetical protein|uniref:Uncharacterized protein n=1 Tax=Paenibacillus tritici TaxID=1873425 RepID=A0ABX2DXK6_9BACL|nr:hypothetical protein [Paenibacillus tritici]NQX49451.1 hypothetical protein [Paenibacillus tritici]
MRFIKNKDNLQNEQEPARIYLGPNLRGGRLLQSTVFRSGIPAYLLPLLEEQPDVAELIIPVEQMTAVQERIVQAGTAEYAVYQRLLGKGI